MSQSLLGASIPAVDTDSLAAQSSGSQDTFRETQVPSEAIFFKVINEKRQRLCNTTALAKQGFKTSPIWLHGISAMEEKTQTRYWVCKICTLQDHRLDIH